MIAVLMPMTSPRMLSSGPPELPRLMAASVWMYSRSRPGIGLSCVSTRPTALTTPTVTVFENENGLPIAMTQSPAAICAESPNFASGRPLGSPIS